MNHNDFYAVLDAIESFYKEEKTVSSHSEGTFAVAFDDKSKKFLGMEEDEQCCVRENRCWWCDKDLSEDGVNVTIAYDALIETIRYCFEHSLSTFTDVPDEILFKDLDTTPVDYSKQDIDCPLKDFSNDYELRSLIALADYPVELAERLWECRKEDNWCLKEFKDFPKYNNRVFIKLTDADRALLKRYGETSKYIVISKNPLDYFYCSYGNSFQSCFALNSGMSCWYGYVPFASTPESYMVYLSDGTVTDVSLLNGKKFHLPQMYLRCWAYAGKDGELIVDKFYRSDNSYIMPMIKFLSSKFNALFLKNDSNKERDLYNKGKGIYKIWDKYDLRFYSDSLRKCGSTIYFKYGDGLRGDTVETERRWRDSEGNGTFTEYCKKVKDVEKDIAFDKPIALVDGILCNPVICPITNMPITKDKDKSPYAKYFTKPVKDLCIVNFIDDKIWWSYNTLKESQGGNDLIVSVTKDPTKLDGGLLRIRNRAYESVGVPLKRLKELLKADIEDTAFDAILLRVVEDDKVTCQVFRNIKKEKANERLAKAV